MMQHKPKGVRFPAIRRWMLAHGMTGVQLVATVGTSSTTIYNMLNGSTDPSLRIVKGVLAVTGMTFEEAFKGAERQMPDKGHDWRLQRRL